MIAYNLIRFAKKWTLPVAIVVGTVSYLTFYYIPALDRAGDVLLRVFDSLLPKLVFLMLLITFCKIDFAQMRLHRWHAGVLAVQVLLVVVNVGVILWLKRHQSQCAILSPIVWEAILTCAIAPTAAAASVVVGKLGGNMATMTSFILLSSLASALMIPVVFPMLEQTVSVDFWEAAWLILRKLSTVLLLPLVLGWLMQRYAKGVCQWIAKYPNLNFYCWAVTLSITTGITVKNIVHSEASARVLILVAVTTFLLCLVQFGLGRGVGHVLGKKVNAGQALFQKNTALSIWVSYMYLSPVASIGAGCYVLWQNIINSLELWLTESKKQ